jgi:hypothetical protein
MEFLTLLTALKSAGLDVGMIGVVMSVAYVFSRFVKKQNAELKTVVSSEVDKIVKAITEHNHRLGALETNVSCLNDDMTEVKKKLNIEYKL